MTTTARKRAIGAVLAAALIPVGLLLGAGQAAAAPDPNDCDAIAFCAIAIAGTDAEHDWWVSAGHQRGCW